MTPRAREVPIGYPSWVNDSTTGGMTIKWMALSKSRNSTGNAVRMIPAQDLLGCMKVPPLNNHPPFYHATPPVGFFCHCEARSLVEGRNAPNPYFPLPWGEGRVRGL